MNQLKVKVNLYFSVFFISRFYYFTEASFTCYYDLLVFNVYLVSCLYFLM